MTIEFAEPDIFDTELLKRMTSKIEEYEARAEGYKSQGDNHRAKAYYYIIRGARRMKNMYESDLKGFSDTMPTGFVDL